MRRLIKNYFRKRRLRKMREHEAKAARPMHNPNVLRALYFVNDPRDG